MRRVVLTALLGGLLGTAPLAAQETAAPARPAPLCQLFPSPPPASVPAADAPAPGVVEWPGEAAGVPVWQPAWGLAGLRVINGPRIAPNGEKYHPSFSLDMNINFWLWPSQGIYLFGDMRFWGERPEYGVTNGRDGGLGFSKREFDISGGPAWNYAGAWEARVSGYALNNLNRGTDQVQPTGELDGALIENRYYLSPEYARLGEPGFDVARATFLSVGVYPTKQLIGNDGQTFKPLGMLRAYLTYDLVEAWPVYAFGDFTLIADRTLDPKLLLFDVGVAARPFHEWRQWEFRAGAENTADLQAHQVLSLWYVALRYIF
jgi:hypothetical protein